MINLLPEKEKKELESGKNRKVILILGILCLFFLACLILLLFLFKIYLFSQINFRKEVLFNKERELKAIPQFQDFKQTSKEANQELVKVKNFYQNQILVIPILETLPKLVPSRVYFTRLSIQKPEISEKEKDYLFKISVWGYAKNREDLFLFQKALRENDKFKDVEVSLQSWLEPIDVDFSLTFKIR
jgi:Tfp pilus assembly protein PilN